jgi:hypothetical protein
MRSARFGGFVLALALLIGACGGGGGSKAASSNVVGGTASSDSSSAAGGGGGGGSVEACKLSESDVSSIVGFTVKKQDGSSGSNCTFSSLDTDSDHVGASVSFSVSSFSGGATETKAIVDAIASTFSTSAVDIPGVGDKSFFIDAGIVGELVVFTGKSQITVAIGGLDQDTTKRKDQLVSLAKKLLS